MIITNSTENWFHNLSHIEVTVCGSWRSDFPLACFFGGLPTKARSPRPVCGVSCEWCVWSVRRPPLSPTTWKLSSRINISSCQSAIQRRALTLLLWDGYSHNPGFSFETLSHLCWSETQTSSSDPVDPISGVLKCLGFRVLSCRSWWFVISHFSLFIFICPFYISNKPDVWPPTPFIMYQSQLAGHVINRFPPMCMQVNMNMFEHVCCASIMSVWCKSIILRVAGRNLPVFKCQPRAIWKKPSIVDLDFQEQHFPRLQMLMQLPLQLCNKISHHPCSWKAPSH